MVLPNSAALTGAAATTAGAGFGAATLRGRPLALQAASARQSAATPADRRRGDRSAMACPGRLLRSTKGSTALVLGQRAADQRHEAHIGEPLLGHRAV